MIAGLLLVSCNLNYISPIPNYPVYIQINTNLGEYTTFWQNPLQYLEFKYDNQATTNEQARRGFGGVIVFCDFENNYHAYDLCCPNEVKNNILISPNGAGEAECLECGECYDLTFGNPTKGISKHPLKRYNTMVKNRIIIVSQ